MTWLRGYTKAEPSFERSCDFFRSLPADRIEIIGGEKVKRNTFPDYWNDELWQAIELWSRWKKYGLPFSLGWAEHPAWIIDALETVDAAMREYKEHHNG